MAPKLAYRDRYDWRQGVEPATHAPRSYQPRSGGPPLLFATDIRMTILVTLALADSPLRCADLWRHIGRKNVGCLRELSRRGLVAKWRAGYREAYATLESAHPAAQALRRLLLRVAKVYRFKPAIEQTCLFPRVSAPARSAAFDTRFTFGDRARTMPLLLVFIRQQANTDQIARCIPRMDVNTVRHALLKFKAFGLLRSCRVSRGIAYSLDPSHPLAAELRGVLASLDAAMPQWRLVAENDESSPRRRSRETRFGRRKPGRWKW
jgi:hypothetical protein